MVCGGFAVGGLSIAWSEGNAGVFVDTHVTEVELLEAVNAIDDVFKKMESEGTQTGEAVGAQHKD